jgi:hypothetical protein
MIVPMGMKRDGSNDWVNVVLYECTTCAIVPFEEPTVVNKGRKKSCQLLPLLSLSLQLIFCCHHRCPHCHRCHCCCYRRHHHHPILLFPSLVGCCVDVRCPYLSLHTIMQLLTLLLPAAFATNHCSLPPPPPPLPPPQQQLPLLPGRHHHYHGLNRCCSLTKKEAAVPPPTAYQLQHRCENNNRSRQLGLAKLIYSII